jgi:hypothetical protein
VFEAVSGLLALSLVISRLYGRAIVSCSTCWFIATSKVLLSHLSGETKVLPDGTFRIGMLALTVTEVVGEDAVGVSVVMTQLCVPS